MLIKRKIGIHYAKCIIPLKNFIENKTYQFVKVDNNIFIKNNKSTLKITLNKFKERFVYEKNIKKI